MLTQIGVSFRSTKQHVYSAVFQCSCGRHKVMIVGRVRRGVVKTCGACKFGGCTGKTRNKLRTTWNNMITRCQNESNPDYRKYGGRGISVCSEWESFAAFANDMGCQPNGMTLERIDNNLGYSKENCRWATRLEQARNKRSNRIVTLKGIQMPLVQAAEMLGIDRRELARRLENK